MIWFGGWLDCVLMFDFWVLSCYVCVCCVCCVYVCVWCLCDVWC